MKKYAIPKRTKFLWQIRIGIVGLIPTAVCYSLTGLTLWLLLPAVLLTVFLVAILFWYLPRFFADYDMILSGNSIIINRGVFIKTTHIMPFSRLVYAQSFSTPLAKSMGLAALSLKAARSIIVIPELKISDVEYMIDYLTQGRI